MSDSNRDWGANTDQEIRRRNLMKAVAWLQNWTSELAINGLPKRLTERTSRTLAWLQNTVELGTRSVGSDIREVVLDSRVLEDDDRPDSPAKPHKPNNWEDSSYSDIFASLAGREFIAAQLREVTLPAQVFRSDRATGDSVYCELYVDDSLALHTNAGTDVWVNVLDYLYECRYDGQYWEDSEDRCGLLIDAMDRELLVHVFGEVEARALFLLAGGILPETYEAEEQKDDAAS